MKSYSFASMALAAAGILSTVAAQLNNPVDPLVIKGSKFFYKTNGTQFFMKGVAYQSDYDTNSTGTSTNYVDPLANVSSCQRDIPYLTELQTNVIRVYAIDPTADHSQCMQLLNDAGIYVISDLSAPSTSINSAQPEWNEDLYARYTAVVDALANYTNVLGFFAGNEVSNAPNNTDAAPFVKAAVRDTKSYIASKNYRSIGVGYATADVESIRSYLADFYNCGSDQADAIDFWGYNIYSWCGDSSYQASGYEDRTEFFSNYSVPVFFAEYGCIVPSPRSFSEVGTIYGSNMSAVWSGAIVYMYFQEANGYGLVSVDGNSVSKLPDFTSLSSRIAASATPTGVNSASYSPSNVPQACPTQNVNWTAAASPLPPTPNNEACSCMYNSLSCVVASSVNSDDYMGLFSEACGLGANATNNQNFCAGIEGNGTLGTYGAWSMCSDAQRLSFILNLYYQGQKASNPSACGFSSSAALTSAAKATGVCSSLIAEAGASGTGTVTSQPSGTGAGAAASESGGSSSSSKGAASAIDLHHVHIGMLGVGCYLFVAALSGAAMILL